MCTVTVLPWRGQVRLAANRDELRSRPAALFPRVMSFGQRRAILPVDPASDGTWVAVNDAFLGMAILNVNVQHSARSAVGSLSRGTIIPALLSCDSMSAAVERALRLDARHYASFRLVIIDRRELVEFRSEGNRVRLGRRNNLSSPYLFTSSGLGDRLVEEPRSRLFHEHLGQAGNPVTAQDAFHRHRWPDRPHLSVCMRRSDACTVSHTVVTLGQDSATLVYHADAPDQPAPQSTLHLEAQWEGGS